MYEKAIMPYYRSKGRQSNIIFVAEATSGEKPEVDASTVNGHDPNEDKTDKSTAWTENVSDLNHMDIEDTRLYQLLKPLFLCMKLGGLFYINHDNYDEHHRSRRSKPRFGKIWCCIITGLVSLNFIRAFTFYYAGEELGTVMFFKFLVTCWWCECSTKAINALINSTQKDRLYNCFMLFEKVCTNHTVDQYRPWLRKWLVKSLVQVAVITVGNIIATGYAMYANEELEALFDNTLGPVKQGIKYIDIFRAMNLFMHFVNTYVALLPLVLYKMICLIIYKEFCLVNHNFRDNIDENGLFLGDFEEIRMRHQKISKLVENADGLFNFFVAAAYTADIPMMCIILYDIIYYTVHPSHTILLSVWILFILFHVGVISTFGAMVNYKAHAPLSDVYSLRVNETSPDRQLQVNMFLNKLTATSIGMSALDLFVINKPTILTVVGMLLTYFVVLVQFRTPTNGFVCYCNGANDTMTNGLEPNLTTPAYNLTTINMTGVTP